MISYSWVFPFLEVASIESGFEKVVTSVHWQLTAADGLASVKMHGVCHLPPPGEPFTDYAALTPEIVQGWTEAALGGEFENIKQHLNAQVLLLSPVAVTAQMLPPWATEV